MVVGGEERRGRFGGSDGKATRAMREPRAGTPHTVIPHSARHFGSRRTYKASKLQPLANRRGVCLRRTLRRPWYLAWLQNESEYL